MIFFKRTAVVPEDLCCMHRWHAQLWRQWYMDSEANLLRTTKLCRWQAPHKQKIILPRLRRTEKARRRAGAKMTKQWGPFVFNAYAPIGLCWMFGTSPSPDEVAVWAKPSENREERRDFMVEPLVLHGTSKVVATASPGQPPSWRS